MTASEVVHLPRCESCGQPRYRFQSCSCGHSSYLHELGKRKGVTVRTACSHYSSEGGYCPCRMFQEVAHG